MKARALCKAPGCDLHAYVRGFCTKHYQQVKAHGRLTPEREQFRDVQCRLERCTAPARARGLCVRHYHQLLRYGQILPPERENASPDPSRRCTVPGCARRARSRGYCNMHYLRICCEKTTTDDGRETHRVTRKKVAS